MGKMTSVKSSVKYFVFKEGTEKQVMTVEEETSEESESIQDKTSSATVC